MERAIHFLHLEDNPADAEIIREMLGESFPGCTVELVGSEPSYRCALELGEIDVVLSDYSLPGFGGMAALEILLSRQEDTPFIFVSGAMGEEIAIESLKSGATDYVMKSRLTRLVPAIRRALREIGDRRKREMAEYDLRKFRTVIEQSPVSIMITDSRGKIEYVNPKFTHISGYKADEVRGLSPNLLRSGTTSTEEYRRLWETITGGGEWRGEFCNRRKDGSLFHELAIIAPVRDGHGNITNYIGIKEDITHRKELEKQLMHAQKMEAIGTLAGAIAHDFNNILTAIIGYSTLLQRNPDNPVKAREYADLLLAMADKAANLTKGMLAFSRNQSLSPKLVNLNEIVENLGKLVGRLIGEDVLLEIELAPKGLIANVDYGQIEQVLMNLCTNARDAMPDGGRITIATGDLFVEEGDLPPDLSGSSGRYARLTVSDTGCGMDESVQAHIFEPFFTTKEAGKGTGLGLSILYGIIRQHKGYVTVRSLPGKGTTFDVYLPLAVMKGDVAEVDPLPPVRGGTETILLAEDDAAVRKIMALTLTQYGYTVIEASDGAEAVDRFAANAAAIPLAIIDVIMPALSGRMVFEAIAKLSPGVKALFVSGYTADIIERKGMLPAGAAFLAKPASPMELLRKVREILDGGRNAGQKDG